MLEKSAARKWLEQEYLPLLEGSVLFVGVRKYNSGYHHIGNYPELFETVDPDPEQAKYGAPMHHICTAEQLIDRGYCYDHVAAFGLVGMRDSLRRTRDEITEMLSTLHGAALKTFMFGGSTDTVTMEELSEWFDSAITAHWHTRSSFVTPPSKTHSPMLIKWLQHA